MQPRHERSGALLPTLLLCLAPLAGAYPPVHASSSSAVVPPLPSIAAEHVRWHAPSGTELARSRIELSPAGLRVRERSGGEDLEMIQDFAGERLWFVDRRRGIAHELSVDPPAPVADTGARAVPTNGFIGSEPCAGATRRFERPGSWHGRRVAAWRCLDERGGTVAVELVDAGHGIVVRRRTADGHVDELRDIRVRAFATGHFSSPPSRFRAVDAREFVLGAPAIGPFRERGRHPADGP